MEKRIKVPEELPNEPTDSPITPTSMLYWFPKIQGCGVPIPKTKIVEIPFKNLVCLLDGEPLPQKYVNAITEACKEIGFPLFMRTDMGSAKHSWRYTCYVPDAEGLHITNLIDETLCCGIFGELDPHALVFREFLPLYSTFKAFSDMPVAKERRYFIKDGHVVCHHPYWIPEAIEGHCEEPDWQDKLRELNEESSDEIIRLTLYAHNIASILKGYWSVDFAYSTNGSWYLIDMAEGDKSWHPVH
jgi:hypothetical protein